MMRRQIADLEEDKAELESQLVESLNAVGTIKRFGLESFAKSKTETKFISLLKLDVINYCFSCFC